MSHTLPSLSRLTLSLLIAAASVASVTTATAQDSQKKYWFLHAVPVLKSSEGGQSPSAPQPPTPEIALQPAELPKGQVGENYSFDFRSVTTARHVPADGSVQYSFGALTAPGGLALGNNGMLAGQPSVATPESGASFDVVGSFGGASGQQTYRIVIDPPAQITLSTMELPEATVGRDYRFDFKDVTTVSYMPGIESVAFKRGTGTVPSGLTLGQDGVLSGKPTAETAEEGVGFEVVGSYKSVSGKQTYTLKVGDVALEVVEIAAGQNHTCAITPQGAVKCWGLGNNGQLGNGGTADSNVPVQVSGLTSGVTSIALGVSHTCAVVSGAAMCWGAQHASTPRLGDGGTASSLVPVQVSGLTSGVASVSAGEGHTCALTLQGAVMCWGNGSYGQLGNGGTTPSKVPVQVSGLTSGVSSISAVSQHTCAVVSGAAKCWGYGLYGRLGSGGTTNSSVPAQVVGLTSGVSSISAGKSHTCAVVGGAAKCWGENRFGSLGNGSTNEGTSLAPAQVAGLTSGVSSISAGNYRACAIVSGAAKCWGFNNNGALGDGSTKNSAVPVQVVGLTSGVSSVTVGVYFHVCAVVSGAAKCWGVNTYGQLGNRSELASNVPVSVKLGS